MDRYENTQHISQGCDAIKGLRNLRHNKIQQYLKNILLKLGYSVTEEPIYTIGNRYLKPPLLVNKGNLAVIIDVQIVSDSTQNSIYNLDRFKVEKYDIPEIREKLSQDGFSRIIFASLTTSWRGVIAPDSWAILKKLGLKSHNAKSIAVQVLSTTHQMYRTWCLSPPV